MNRSQSLDSICNTQRIITPQTRVSIRVKAGINRQTGRPQYSHLVGHITQCSNNIVYFHRDPAANGSRNEEDLTLKVDDILVLKIIPERKSFSCSSSIAKH